MPRTHKLHHPVCTYIFAWWIKGNELSLLILSHNLSSIVNIYYIYLSISEIFFLLNTLFLNVNLLEKEKQKYFQITEIFLFSPVQNLCIFVKETYATCLYQDMGLCFSKRLNETLLCKGF